jgi:EmrB/QacA subfamily drug resistance transporter
MDGGSPVNLPATARDEPDESQLGEGQHHHDTLIARRRRLSIVVVLVGVFVSSLDLFIVNIAFPELERSFQSSSPSGLQWVLSAYAIVFAALLVPAGRWADGAGRKRAFLCGLALFTVASAGCAIASSVGVLVAARVAQAVGGALMLPTSLGLLLPLYPPARRGGAIGLWAAVGGAAAAAGPPIGGLLVQASWRWVFLVNIPIGLVTLLVGWRVLREIREESRTPPDVFGALVLAGTVAALVAAIVQGEDWGRGGPRVLGLIALGALGLAFSVWHARHHPAPVVEPAIVRIRAVALANLAGLAFFAGFGAMILSSVLFLTGVWHHSALRAGLEIAPGPVMAAPFAVLGGVLGTRYGPRPVGMVGSVLFAAGGVWWATASGTSPNYASSFLPGGIIAGIGAGLVLPSLSSAATLPLPPERFATGTALLVMFRQIGLALGVAVVVALLGVRPDVFAFHTTWIFMAACSLAAGLTLSTIGRGAHVVPGQASSAPVSDEATRDAVTSPDASPRTVERARERDLSQPLRQQHADAIQPNDAESPTLRLGNQPLRGLKMAVSLAGACAVAGVGLFLLLRADDARQVTVYSSLPLQGPQRGRSEDMLRGMRLALKEAGNKAGKFDVKFVSLDDSTAEARGWESSAVIANATRAAADGDTAVYIGEQNSGASALSIPVLSSAKVPQISPSNTAVGLTTEESGADRGEPGKYYVGGFRNYVRLVPRDTIQGSALATLMKRDGCERAAIIHDRELYGEGLADNIRGALQTEGLPRVLDEPFESREPAYHRTLARRLVLQRADCVIFSGNDTSGALRLFKAVGGALPRARLYGADGLAERAFTDANRGGLPEPLAARMKLTVAALGPEGFGAAGKTFFARFRQEYPDHKNPNPYAIYGYEAMSLALDAIARAGSDDRADIVKALFDTKDRSSVIGRYSIDDNGDTTLTDYGVFAIRDGAPTFERTITPRH